MISRCQYPHVRADLDFWRITGYFANVTNSLSLSLPPSLSLSLSLPPSLSLPLSCQVVTYPSSSEVSSILSEVTEQPFFLVPRQGGTELTGYKVLLDEQDTPLNDYSGPLFSTKQFWHVQFPPDSEKIVSVQLKRANGEIFVKSCLSSYMH